MDDIGDTIAYWQDERVMAKEVLQSMGYCAAGNACWGYVEEIMRTGRMRPKSDALWLSTERELNGG